jgi:hypothetical protein
MNERIKQLAEQSGANYYSLGNRFEKFDEHKFALLIIRECMACSRWVGKVNKLPNEPIHTAMAINKRITQQLGVE